MSFCTTRNRTSAFSCQCALWVISGHMRHTTGMSALPPIATAKAANAPQKGDVRFTPQNGHVRCKQECWLRANSGLMQCSSQSMTSSARGSSDGGIVRPNAFAVLRLITKLKPVHLHDRQVGGLFAAEKSPGVDASLPITFRDARSVAHQATSQRKLATSR